MFQAKILDDGGIELSGWLDAAQTDKADRVLSQINNSRTLYLNNLEYISSAGLGILLAHQKRLKDIGHALKLVGLTKHVKDVFVLTGFDNIFEIE